MTSQLSQWKRLNGFVFRNPMAIMMRHEMWAIVAIFGMCCMDYFAVDVINNIQGRCLARGALNANHVASLQGVPQGDILH